MHTHTWFNMHIAHENKSINILLLKSSADLPGSQQLLGRPLGHGRLGLASPGTQWLGSGAAMRMRFCQLGVRGTTGAGDLTHFGVKNTRKTSELRCEKKTFWGNMFYFGNTERPELWPQELWESCNYLPTCPRCRPWILKVHRGFALSYWPLFKIAIYWWRIPIFEVTVWTSDTAAYLHRHHGVLSHCIRIISPLGWWTSALCCQNDHSWGAQTELVSDRCSAPALPAVKLFDEVPIGIGLG